MITIAKAAEIVADVMQGCGSVDAAWGAVVRSWPEVTQSDQDRIIELAAAKLRHRSAIAASWRAPHGRS
jgi:hypothetical protein